MGDRYAETETSDAQVVKLPRVAVRDTGTDTEEAQVGRWAFVVAMDRIRKAGRAREYT